MPNLLDNGAAWLAERLKETAGRTVSIQQGPATITTIVGVLVIDETEVIDEQGFMTQVVHQDWTFATADLVADGEPLVLRQGATIIETIDGVETVYEALPIGPKPAAEGLDTGGLMTVVRTRKTPGNG